MVGKKSLTLLLLLFTVVLSAQTTDLARIEYLYLPFSKSGNSISRYRVLAQIPFRVHKEKKNFIVFGMEYRYLDIEISDTEDRFALANGNNISSIQRIDAYIGYTWKHNENWRFGVKAGPKIQSDFQGKLHKEDFIYEVGVYAIKDRRKDREEGKKPSRFIFGLTYSTYPGRWYPLPILNYYKEFHPDWTYTLGLPKTNIRHYLNSTHKDAIQAFATLDNDFAHVHNGFVPLSSDGNSDGRKAQNIQVTMGLLGLGYEHFFTENLLFYAYAAHSVYNNFRFEDDDGKKVYQINNENSPYFRAGLKFKY